MGRLKLTPETTEIICETLRKGNYKTTAARAAGISVSTLNLWLKKGEEGIEPYKTFREKADVAEAEGELALVDIIQENAINGVWTSAAWMLERKHPDRWGRKERMDISSDKDFNISFQSVKSTHEMDEDEKQLLEDND